MRKLALLMVLFMLCAVLSGCVTVRKVTKELTSDREITGNEGYLVGQAPVTERPERKRTREHIQIDVELPTVEWSR